MSWRIQITIVEDTDGTLVNEDIEGVWDLWGHGLSGPDPAGKYQQRLSVSRSWEPSDPT